MSDERWSPVDPGAAPGAPPYGPPQYGGPFPAPYGPPQYGAAPPPGTPYGAPPAWTPPPKPGLLPLRPLGFGQLLGAPFQQLRRNAGPVVGSGLLVGAASSILAAAAVAPFLFWAIGRAESAASDDLDTVLTGGIALVVVVAIVASLVSIVLSAFLQGVVITDVARGTLGERPRFGALWRAAAKRVWALIGWSLLVGAIVLVGILLFVLLFVAGAAIGGPVGIIAAVVLGLLLGLGAVVLALWLQAKLVAVPSLIVLERSRLFPAIARSWRLTTGRFWPIFGVLLLVQTIVQVGGQIVTAPLSLLAPVVVGLLDPTGAGAGAVITVVLSVLSLVVGVVVGGIGAVVLASIGGVITIDQRMRREGLDLELQRVVEARAAGLPTGDPFAAPGSPEAGAPGAPSPWTAGRPPGTR